MISQDLFCYRLGFLVGNIHAFKGFPQNLVFLQERELLVMVANLWASAVVYNDLAWADKYHRYKDLTSKLSLDT